MACSGQENTQRKVTLGVPVLLTNRSNRYFRVVTGIVQELFGRFNEDGLSNPRCLVYQSIECSRTNSGFAIVSTQDIVNFKQHGAASDSHNVTERRSGTRKQS